MIANKPTRKIIHLDMDAFYAAIEQRDNPAYRGKPIVVGASPGKRGVVATASYEARKFGINSAMSSTRASHLCPSAIFVKPRMPVYRSVSKRIHEIFYTYTDLVESMGIDEAYLDVTINKKTIPSAQWVAERIRSDIFRNTGLTASAGVSFNKFLAKIASDINKPDGITVITPGEAEQFINNLPIRKFHGIGKSTEAKMLSLGIRTGADLKRLSMAEIIYHFGKTGSFFYQIVHGQDDRPVCPHRRRKSVGAEQTFPNDLRDGTQINSKIADLCGAVASRLEQLAASGKTVTVKIRYDDFTTITRSKTVNDYINEPITIAILAGELLRTTAAGERPVRLLGVSMSNLNTIHDDTATDQLVLPL